MNLGNNFFKGIFKSLDFPYTVIEKNFDDLWKLMEGYREIQIKLGNLLKKLFPIGSKISFPAHGNIRKGIIKRICRDGQIVYINDKNKEETVPACYLLQEFHWREIFPMRAKRIDENG